MVGDGLLQTGLSGFLRPWQAELSILKGFQDKKGCCPLVTDSSVRGGNEALMQIFLS